MPRLIVNPRLPSQQTIMLKPGTNSIGRTADNDFRIDEPSVSSHHCQIEVGSDGVTLKDLGSTNGTFLNRAPVQECPLQAGAVIHFGTVEVLFCGDVAPQPPPVAEPAIETGSHCCKHHPKIPARYVCHHCRQYFCEACISLRHLGAQQQKTCRHCGKDVAPFRFEVQAGSDKGFFGRIPSAFLYPLRGAGVVIVVVGIVLVTMLKFGALMMKFGSLRVLMFGIILQICAGGYLFSFLQNILHSTAAEDKELPDLPSISNFLDDVIIPFCRFLGLLVLCFGPAIACSVWVLLTGNPTGVIAVYTSTVLGYLYFPMAFLAVAILDSFGAANPLLVLPSILKVPFEYLVSVLFLAASFLFRYCGDILLAKLFPEGFGTDSMGKLFGLIGMNLFWAFASLYLLLVATHLLGLIYVARKGRLGWLER